MKEQVGFFSSWNCIIPIFIILCLCHLNVLGAGTLNEESNTSTKGSPISSEPPIPAKKCPGSSTILPCRCISSTPYGISCRGTSVNQTTITTAFREIRKVNGIPEGRGIHIDQFILSETQLTQLDLAPFYGSRMDSLSIEFNANLRKFVTSGNSQHHGSIHVTTLYLIINSLTQETFGDAFKYFSKVMDSFTVLCLPLFRHKERDVHADAGADKDGNDGDGEFLPGLSSLTNLSNLYIAYCDINGELNRDNWNFTRFHRIQRIDLSYNRINGIGDRVFDFDLDDELRIYLAYNQLNETSFHPDSGITRAGRRTILHLSYNQIRTLPVSIFETFLDAHPQNSLQLEQNPLICDERLSWIKSRRWEFKSRVKGANCKNDPGRTVFNSLLIPIPPRFPPIFASLCPDSSTILPCTCSNSSTGLSIFCSGSDVNQASIETGFREIREVNGIPEGRGVHIYEFVLNETELFVLDLAPFYGSQMDSLSIVFNANLIILVTPGYEEDQGSIQVNLLQILNSPLGDFGFGELLKYFTNDRKSTVDLSNNRITTLPAPTFETFLDAQPQNFLRLTGNPLICDKSLSWIKARAFEFVYWVENANCANDPGHTVFNSALIP